MVFTFAILPKAGMISFGEALVVASMYGFCRYPDDPNSVLEVSKLVDPFVMRIQSQKMIFANLTRDGQLVCYSKSKRKPIEMSAALDLQSIENTSDIVIHGNDLLGSQYPANLLPNVIENAREILRNNPSIFTACCATKNPIKNAKTDSQNTSDSTPSVNVRANKLRRNTLDPAIDKAIQQAGNYDLADVYLKLKSIALDNEMPFTGEIQGDALCYTNDDNEPDKLTKEALRVRLKRRKNLRPPT